MRIYLVFAIITFAKAQADLLSMPSNLKQDFGDANEHIEELNDKINEKQKQDYDDEKERLIDQFLLDSQAVLDNYSDVENKRDHDIGHFKVTIQKKCTIDLPELELPTEPHEVDCFSGAYSGKYLAEALTKITKDNLQNPKKAMGVLYDCELLMQQELTLTLYEKCFEGEFGLYYEQYFNEFVDQMSKKNFIYDAETNKFVYKSDKVVLDRETGETTLVKPNQISL